MILLSEKASFLLVFAAVLFPFSIIVFRLELVVAVLTIILVVLLDIILFYLRTRKISHIKIIRANIPSRVIADSLLDIKIVIEVEGYQGLISVFDPLPEGLIIVKGKNNKTIHVNGIGEKRIELKYTIKAVARGDYVIGPVRLILISPLGFCGKPIQKLEKTQTYLKVVPQFYALRFKEAPVITRYTKPPGGHPAKVKGIGVELEHIREYMPGDDFRKIAWKASAKNPLRKIMVRETTSEVRLELFLVIDGGIESSLGYPRRLIDYYIEATGSLILAALDRGDVIGLYIAGTPSLLVPPTRRREYLYTALNIIETLNPSYSRTILHRVPEIISSVLPKRSATLFFFTSMENVLEPGEIVDKLRALGYNLVFFIPYTPSFIKLKPGYEKLKRIYDYIVEKEIDRIEKIKNLLLIHGAKVVVASREDFVERVLREYYMLREYA